MSPTRPETVTTRDSGRAASPCALYFHNGMAADLGKAVDFYNTRFMIVFTDQERADLIAFLEAL